MVSVEGLREAEVMPPVDGSKTTKGLPVRKLGRRGFLGWGAGFVAFASTASNRLPNSLWLPPSAQAAELPNKKELVLPSTRCVINRNGGVEAKETVTPLTINDILIPNSRRYGPECGQYAHVGGELSSKFRSIERYTVIAFLSGTEHAQAYSTSSPFIQQARSYNNLVTAVLSELVENKINIRSQTYEEAIRLEKSGYSHNDEIMYEIMSSGRYSVDLKNGIYQIAEIILLANQDVYNALGANGGTFGRGGVTSLPAEVILNQHKVYALVVGIHEILHALGLLEHSKNLDSFLNNGIGTNDSSPKMLEEDLVRRICGGGQVFTPAGLNVYKPSASP